MLLTAWRTANTPWQPNPKNERHLERKLRNKLGHYRNLWDRYLKGQASLLWAYPMRNNTVLEQWTVGCDNKSRGPSSTWQARLQHATLSSSLASSNAKGCIFQRYNLWNFAAPSGLAFLLPPCRWLRKAEQSDIVGEVCYFFPHGDNVTGKAPTTSANLWGWRDFWVKLECSEAAGSSVLAVPEVETTPAIEEWRNLLDLKTDTEKG